MSLQSINLYKKLANNKLISKSINFDLKRIKLVLKKLNNPERKIGNVISIIGSDGKYSLLTSLKYFIEANNQKTSAYISPSLKDIRERFWIGTRYLSFKEIAESAKIIQNQKVPLTVFELLTVIFIVNVASKNNDYNLIEAGALFAKDSTNVFDFPLIQAIVNINKQHLNFVKKKTINEIINQKVGYLSNFTKIYIGKQNSNTNKKIKIILKKNSSEKVFSQSWKLLKIKKDYYYKDSNIKIKLKSKYILSKGLRENLCLAIKIALDLNIKVNLIKKTIPKIKFEGRIDYLQKGKIKNKLFKKEKFLLDGCHSKVSANNLSKYLRVIKAPKYGIWGMTKNKNPDEFIKQFKNIFTKIIAIPISNEKDSLDNCFLKKIANENNIKCETADNFYAALKKISDDKKKIICVFGSLYLCGEVLNKN